MPDQGAASLPELLELIESLPVAMLTTRASDGFLVSRPLATQPADEDGSLWFITAASSGKIDEIRIDPRVNVAYSSVDRDAWISVSGVATLERDRGRIDQLWRPALDAFFPLGKEDPDLALLWVTIHRAEYWTGPSAKIARAWRLVQAAVTGMPGTLAEHQHLDVRKAG